MTYSFRIRFNRVPTDTIDSELKELPLSAQQENLSIVLSSQNDGLSIKDSNRLSLSGKGLSSPEEAGRASLSLQSVLMGT